MPTKTEKQDVLLKILAFVRHYKMSDYPSCDPDSMRKWRLVKVEASMEDSFDGTSAEEDYKNFIGYVYFVHNWRHDETWIEPYATRNNAYLYYSNLMEAIAITFPSYSVYFDMDTNYNRHLVILMIKLENKDSCFSIDNKFVTNGLELLQPHNNGLSHLAIRHKRKLEYKQLFNEEGTSIDIPNIDLPIQSDKRNITSKSPLNTNQGKL